MLIACGLSNKYITLKNAHNLLKETYIGQLHEANDHIWKVLSHFRPVKCGLQVVRNRLESEKLVEFVETLVRAT